MRRADLLVIMGAIWLGLGIAHDKVILSAMACAAFLVAGRQGRRSRSAADESESDRWERDKRLGQRLVPGAARHLPPPRPDAPPPPPPPSGGRR